MRRIHHSSNKLDSLKDFITTCLNLLEINYEILQSKENNTVDKSTGKPFIESNPAKYREVDFTESRVTIQKY